MWDIPLSLNRWPNQFPDIHHVQPFYKPFEPESQPFHPPWPGKGNFALALRRRNKRISPRKKIHSLLSYKCASREEFSIKDQKKAKEKKNIPDQDRKKAKKKREKIPDQRSEESEKKKFLTKDRKKAKEKEIPNQRLEEDKEVNRKVFGPNNI